MRLRVSICLALSAIQTIQPCSKIESHAYGCVATLLRGRSEA